MKNSQIQFFALLISILIFTACNTEEEPVFESKENSPFTTISKLENNSTIHNSITSKYGNFISSKSSSNKKQNTFGDVDLNAAEVGNYLDTDLVSTVVPFNEGNAYLLVLGKKDGSIIEEFIADFEYVNDSKTNIDYYDLDGNATISFSVVNGTVQNVVKHAATNGKVKSWDSCTTCAVTSCGADGGCTIMCGLTGPWCLTAIALACIGSDLAC